MKLNYDLYLNSNPNPRDTNNIVVKGELEGNKLVSIDSMKIGDRELVSGGSSNKSIILDLEQAPNKVSNNFSTKEEAIQALGITEEQFDAILNTEIYAVRYPILDEEEQELIYITMTLPAGTKLFPSNPKNGRYEYDFNNDGYYFTSYIDIGYYEENEEYSIMFHYEGGATS